MPLFDSFFLGSFESACYINKSGSGLDMLTITQHNRQVLADYELLCGFDIRTVRDGTIWPQIERAGAYDFFVSSADAGCSEPAWHAGTMERAALWLSRRPGCHVAHVCRSLTRYGRHHHLSDHRPARLGRSRALAQQRAVGPVLR